MNILLSITAIFYLMTSCATLVEGNDTDKDLAMLLNDIAKLQGSLANDQEEDLPDPIVSAKLKKSGIKFLVDDDGDFMLMFNHGITMYVESRRKTIGPLKVRGVFSAVHDAPKPLSNEQMQNLLLENAGYKVGGWQVDSSGHVIFRADVSAEADENELRTVIVVVAYAVQTLRESWVSRGWLVTTSDEL